MNEKDMAEYIKERLREQKITDEPTEYLKKWTKGWNNGISHSMKMIDEILHDYNSKGDQTMKSKTDKMNELKKVMKQRATDAMAAMDDDLICYGIQCNDCEYHSDTADKWETKCKIAQAQNLISEVIKLSEIAPPQYVIVSKSERVFGPASKEACEARAEGFINVEIKEV